jgi:hypothetical protein
MLNKTQVVIKEVLTFLLQKTCENTGKDGCLQGRKNRVTTRSDRWKNQISGTENLLVALKTDLKFVM